MYILEFLNLLKKNCNKVEKNSFNLSPSPSLFLPISLSLPSSLSLYLSLSLSLFLSFSKFPKKSAMKLKKHL
jgi:hypothetical protein